MGKKLFISGFTLILLLVLLQCSSKPTESEKKVRQLTAEERELVGSANAFGLKLFREVVSQEPDTNLFISPLSVAMALGMTYNGARNETREAMQEVLELKGMTIEEVNQSYRSLIDLLLGLDPAVKFRIANSIWYREGFSVEQDFIDLNQTYFDALVRALDFDDPEAADIINAWVDENTNGKIKEIIDQIGPLVVMYLINAIYFNGDWTYQFDPENTHNSFFEQPDGSHVPCQMMTQETEFRYLQGDDFAALDMPYGQRDYSMTIFLPDSPSGLNDLIGRFTDENWEEWLSKLTERDMVVYLPKFEQEYKLRLNDALVALGMGVAFDAYQADFTGINPEGWLYISKVQHKTYVKVDEEGTEAAAVTAVEISLTSIRENVFRADHPFVYVIRENRSGTILFIGKMVKPAWED